MIRSASAKSEEDFRVDLSPGQSGNLVHAMADSDIINSSTTNRDFVLDMIANVHSVDPSIAKG